jgi:5'-nucleotidase
MRSAKQFLFGSLGAALALSGFTVLAAGPVQANPAGTDLVINEVYGGGGNAGAVYTNDFIELFNPTGAAIPLEGKSLQYRSAAATTAAPGSTGVFAFPAGSSVPAHGYYLVQAAAGATPVAPLPMTPDATVPGTNLNLSGTGGQIFLANTTTALAPVTNAAAPWTFSGSVVDFVGWGSSTVTFEGTDKAAATANGTSTSRAATHADSNNNIADFATGVPTPKNSTITEGGDPEPADLVADSESDITTTVDAQVSATLTATGGKEPYAWSATGLPAGVTLSAAGALSGSPTTAGTYPVTATVTDDSDPEQTDEVTFTITVGPAPETLPIATIQGNGERSPYAPETGTGQGTEVVTTTGVVTGMYKDPSFANNGFDGFTIQTGGTGPGTTTGGASDGVFVYYGSNTLPAGIAVGDSVRVTGKVSEFFGLTEINVTGTGVTELGTALPAVTPLPTGFPTTDAAREVLESMLIAPTGDFTVTNAYATNQYAEIGLAAGDGPLRQPTEFADAGDDAAVQAIRDENAERAVTLDDGTGVNYLGNQTTKAQPVPWLTQGAGANPVPPRVGAGVTFHAPVVVDYRNDIWKLQPQQPVTTDGAAIATFEDTRADNVVPRDVLGAEGDLKIATFNVLNYFNTTGEAYAAAGPLQNPPLDTFCTYYTDRGPGTAQRIGNNSCGVRLLDDPDTAKDESQDNDGRGPRGAATAASLARQEAKLASTVTALGADVVGLEEIENSIKLPGETNRDDAVARVVAILNNAAGSTVWAYVKSPGEALTAAAVGEQDTIRPAFIYKVDSVEPVGKSDILFGTDEFANAREPLAQVFKAKGAPDADGFAVIVNHFKSKGDSCTAQEAEQGSPKCAVGDNKSDGEVGAFNGDRVRQANRLLQFADDFKTDRGVDAVFLAGDFNAYSMEDPVQAIEAGGFDPVESTDAADESYSYDGLSGSLDHVFGNAAAMDMVTGADIWEINANEAASYQYSRYNYNVTDFWLPNKPWATSDHNPEIVGIKVPDFTPTSYQEIQVIGTNDFHGRLLPDAGNAAGAAPFATAVKELRAENPDTVFVAAGDLVGASTFESFIQKDEPTIDALNAMGLEVSAAGNHEFDQGYADFEGRIRDRANWEYIAANIDYDASVPEADRLAETWTKTIDGKKIGFVGAVTEDLPALVNPAGIDQLTVTDIVDATNAAAAALKADGAEVVVLLVHEGAPTASCSAGTDAATTWGNIVQNSSSDVDAIISGHTHLAYNCKYAVADWANRAVTKRPVVSAGQYGTNLNKLVFKFDEGSGELAAISQDVIATAGVGYAPDPTVQAIVDDAVDFAEAAGSAQLGRMTGDFKRARYLPGGVSTENRGGESTLGNQVAEIQRWATDQAGIDTDIAFMNPGGLRADMPVTIVDQAYLDAHPGSGLALGDKILTYRNAADVQPFANTLVNLKLTGAQIKTVLEQQWQRTPQGGVPSRPFLRLGVSKGFTYTYVETPVTVSAPNSAPVNTFKGTVTGMWLDGQQVDLAHVYSVTVNSFLGGGGDNFRELANGTGKVDTGKVDLAAVVDYMKQYDADHPLVVDSSQRAVELTLPNDAPAAYQPGDTVTFDIASWAMSAAGDATDDDLQVKLGNTVLGSFPVTKTVGNTPYDNTGTASVSVQLPADVPNGTVELTVYGPTTKTSVPLVLAVDDVEDIQIVGTNDFHGRLLVDESPASATCATVLCPASKLSGTVKQLRTQNPNTVFVAAGDLIGASTFESFIQKDEPTIDALNEAGLEVSAAGNHEFDQGYEDLVGRVQDRANWEYIAANVEEPEGRDDLAETWTKDFGDITVGFVGAVTEELPALVSPAGIEGVTVTDIVDSTNAAAAQLKADGADLVVLLVHEGSASTSCTSPQFTDPATVWGNITQNVSPDVDAIVSGHTHLAYNCSFPVQQWVTDGRTVTERPVVSAGQYGQNINKLVFSVDRSSGDVVAKTQSVVALTASSPSDPAVDAIVNAAKTAAEAQGSVKIGEIGGPFNRARVTGSTDPNRGGESTLGNLVAEVQRWATEKPESGSAQIAFMNPGGLRSDMAGTLNGGVREVTYKGAAVVQPFANTLVNMDLTGAQIETVLEQQWQRDLNGNVPTRPFLRLGTSKGFTYTYTEKPVTVNGTATFQGEVTGMWLDGEPIDPAATYSVTVNSFLGSGGDNFRELANGTGKADTGKVDLQAMVDYLAAFTATTPLPVDYRQHAVQVEVPADAPASYVPGGHVKLAVGSWDMTHPDDVRDDVVTVKLGDDVLGTAALDHTVGADRYDPYGKASVDVVLPNDVAAGPVTLTLVGEDTGTEVPVPITVAEGAFVNDTLPVITGTAKVGQQLTGTAGSWTPTPTSVAYQWLADGTPIADATTSSFTPTPAQAGKVITLRVTVSAAGYSDGVATSDPTAAVADGTFVNDGKPAVTGTAKVGQQLTGTAGSWTPTPTSVAYQWLADGTPIAGATTSSYTLTAAELGRVITVRVTASATGYSNAVATSDPTAAVVAGTFVNTAVPTVSGTARAGRVLTANRGTWSPAPTSVAYQWLADGAPIASATGTTLRLNGTHVGKRISVRVTVKAAGYTDGVKTSAQTAAVVKGPVTMAVRVGPAKVIAKRTRVQLVVTLTNPDGLTVGGTVAVSATGLTARTATVVDGRATVTLRVFPTVGRKTLTIRYGGTSALAGRTTTTTVFVVRR